MWGIISEYSSVKKEGDLVGKQWPLAWRGTSHDTYHNTILQGDIIYIFLLKQLMLNIETIKEIWLVKSLRAV